MEKRRKRRSVEDIEQSILNAATQLIQKNGFNNLTVVGIIQKAQIEPIQFYRRYKDLNSFIDEYVKKYDYWFNDVIKSQKQCNSDNDFYKNILIGLFRSLLKNKEMQELLKWELSTNNETSQRTAQLRELHTLPLCNKYAALFSKSNIDIVATSAIIVGGIYYLILHNDLSTFSGIDLNKESDVERIIKSINDISNTLFTSSTPPQDKIEAIKKMKNDNIEIEKIAYYTGISQDIIKDI